MVTSLHPTASCQKVTLYLNNPSTGPSMNASADASAEASGRRSGHRFTTIPSRCQVAGAGSPGRNGCVRPLDDGQRGDGSRVGSAGCGVGGDATRSGLSAGSTSGEKGEPSWMGRRLRGRSSRTSRHPPPRRQRERRRLNRAAGQKLRQHQRCRRQRHPLPGRRGAGRGVRGRFRLSLCVVPTKLAPPTASWAPIQSMTSWATGPTRPRMGKSANYTCAMYVNGHSQRRQGRHSLVSRRRCGPSASP